MAFKSIEIYYDIAAIPGVARDDRRGALEFRDAAMAHIGRALGAAGAGEWVGAEIGTSFATGQPEVNFGFEVGDFDRAEAIVRQAVAGTPYEGIREITRFDQAAYA